MRLDDDTYLKTPPLHSESIGEIKLVIFRTTMPENILEITKDLYGYFVWPQRPQKVHERSKKLIAHQVKYVVSLCITLNI